MLTGPAIIQCKRGGSCRNAWNLRLVTSTLETGGGYQDVPLEERRNIFYVLQQALVAVPSTVNNVLFGNFNAQVSCSKEDGDECLHISDSNRYGILNAVGREVLSLISTNEATVCNTRH